MIRKITHKEIVPYRHQAEQDGIIFDKTTQLYGVYIRGELVGFTGIRQYQRKAVFKNHWVRRTHRGKGYFKSMVQWSLRQTKGKRIEATCTPMSIRYYRRIGFRPVQYYKNGCVRVWYENL